MNADNILYIHIYIYREILCKHKHFVICQMKPLDRVVRVDVFRVLPWVVQQLQAMSVYQ